MLYHKRSFNYYVRIMTWMRLRVLLTVSSRIGSWKRDRERAGSDTLLGLRGNQDRKVWAIHYHNFLRQGWSYFKARNFVHHCTDGPECPIAYAFTKAQVRKLFRKFEHLEMKLAHFPLKKYCPCVPLRLEKFFAARLGWYLFIFAGKD